MSGMFDDGAERVRFKAGAIAVIVAAANIAAWAVAWAVFRGSPVLMGTALLAYGFGLRHAVDADHIAAIDNVTRKLMQDGKRPVATGFFFSLGHSTIVVLASLAIAATAAAFSSRFAAFQSWGGVIGTTVSATFLLGIAAMNLVILTGIYRTFLRVKAGGAFAEEDLDMLLSGRGFLARLVRPLFRMIRASWQMYLLGFLFGLGFDTATEIGVLGISAVQGTNGMMLWAIMVFPMLFAAGMALVDSADGILMLGAYGWAFLKPVRKLYYNMTITFVSAAVALLVGGIEALGLLVDKLALKGPLWSGLDALDGSLAGIGFWIIGVFAATWLGAAVIYRLRGYDRLEAGT